MVGEICNSSNGSFALYHFFKTKMFNLHWWRTRLIINLVGKDNLCNSVESSCFSEKPLSQDLKMPSSPRIPTRPILPSKFNLTPTFFKKPFLAFTVLGDDPVIWTLVIWYLSLSTQYLVDLITFYVNLVFQILTGP